MNKLFNSLVWPAVAGNILWSLFSLLIGASPSVDNPGPRIVVLVLLGAYLCFDWIRMEASSNHRKPLAWIADLPHAVSVTVFALATASKTEPDVSSVANWLNASLACVLAITAVGHLTTLWELRHQKPCGCRRFCLVAINLVGLGTIYIASDCGPEQTLWNLPIAMVVVLLPWLIITSHWKLHDCHPTARQCGTDGD